MIRLLAEHVIRPRAMGLEGSSHRLTAVMPFFFHFVVFSHHEINISAGSGSRATPIFSFSFQISPIPSCPARLLSLYRYYRQVPQGRPQPMASRGPDDGHKGC